MIISCPVHTAGWPSRPVGTLVVVVAVHWLVERFQRPPVSAKGTMSESWPPQTIIWSVPSMRVKIPDCAVRAVGAFATEIGVQLSAKTADASINGAKHSTILRIII